MTDLPPAVRDLGRRLGADERCEHSTVRMKQRGVMWQEPGANPQAFQARQTMAIKATEFSWRARCGPLGSISVIDYLGDGSFGVKVRLLGLIPLATLIDTPSVAKGETMRYLAELAWAPDAILHNSSLRWRVIDGETFAVTSPARAPGSEVILHLSSDGLIASIDASDRPRIEGKAVVERPWRGVFSDYRVFAGRTVPAHGEVSWLLPAGAFKTWEGDITGWTLA